MDNVVENIENVIKSPEININEQSVKIINSIKTGFKSVFMGRKWVIFYFLGIFPLFFTLFSEDKLFGNPTAESAFARNFFGGWFLLLFNFGCLFMVLPLSADEINDGVIENYLVKPIKRESLWISRWIVATISIWMVSILLSFSYYDFYMIVGNASFSDFIGNLDLLLLSFVFLGFASLFYGTLFLFIGFIGNKGLTIGIIVALFESFFLSLLFLADSQYIPRTHLQNIASSYFKPLYTYVNPNNVTLTFSYLYLIIGTVILFGVGMYYLRNREFK